MRCDAAAAAGCAKGRADRARLAAEALVVNNFMLMLLVLQLLLQWYALRLMRHARWL